MCLVLPHASFLCAKICRWQQGGPFGVISWFGSVLSTCSPPATWERGRGSGGILRPDHPLSAPGPEAQSGQEASQLAQPPAPPGAPGVSIPESNCSHTSQSASPHCVTAREGGGPWPVLLRRDNCPGIPTAIHWLRPLHLDSQPHMLVFLFYIA